MMTVKLKMIVVLMFVYLMLSGCVDDETDWVTSSTFITNNLTLHGSEGKFGIVKANGESDEPEFPVGKGRLYHVYFLDSAETFSGKKYKMLATHQNSEEHVDLYEAIIENNQSGAKFLLEKSGLWKIDVLVNDEQFTSFIVEAK